MGLINAANKVPQHQRVYQAAYKAHTRIWKIVSRIGLKAAKRGPIDEMTQNPRSNVLLTPYLILLWGTTGATMYAMGRKVLGYNTWFSEN
ncbi:hypothetical protein OQA88_4915 [Cercophora sp. LCS_1]